jgi:hypothetical protein
MASLQRQAPPGRLQGRDALEKAWRDLGRRRLDELLSRGLQIKPFAERAAGWWSVSYEDVESKVYAGKDRVVLFVCVDG